eukprot:s1518_g20.t1
MVAMETMDQGTAARPYDARSQLLSAELLDQYRALLSGSHLDLDEVTGSNNSERSDSHTAGDSSQSTSDFMERGGHHPLEPLRPRGAVQPKAEPGRASQVEALPPPETAVICRDGRLIWNL